MSKANVDQIFAFGATLFFMFKVKSSQTMIPIPDPNSYVSHNGLSTCQLHNMGATYNSLYNNSLIEDYKLFNVLFVNENITTISSKTSSLQLMGVFENLACVLIIINESVRMPMS